MALMTVLALPWWAVGQQAPVAPQTPASPQAPTPPVVPSRFMVTPPGGYLGVGIQEITGERAKALKLPTFMMSGMTLLKRMALVIDDGVITKVFYPVFPPDKNAAEVIAWLRRGA